MTTEQKPAATCTSRAARTGDATLAGCTSAELPLALGILRTIRRAGPEPRAAIGLIPLSLSKAKGLFIFFTATRTYSLPQPVPHERKSVTRSPAVCKILSEPPFTFSWGKSVKIDCPGGGNEVTDWELGGTYL